MSKKGNANPRNVEIYNILVQEFPHLFVQLEKVPRELEPAGDQPKVPVRNQSVRVSILPGDTFEDIVKKFEAHRNISHMRHYVIRPMISRAVPIESSTTVEGSWLTDDNTDDDYDDNDRYDRYDYTPVKYGDPSAVVFDFIIEDPNYEEAHRKYEQDMKNHENRVKNRRDRKILIESVVARNKDRIKHTIINHNDLWAAAARMSANQATVQIGASSDFLMKKAEVLRQQLAQIEAQLQENETDPESPWEVIG